MEFTVEVHHEDQGYWVDVLEIPGCLTDARTLNELTIYLEDALQICLEDESLRLVTPLLKPGTARINVVSESEPPLLGSSEA